MGKLETFRQRLLDFEQRAIEYLGIQPAFVHNKGCPVRGGLTIKTEEFPTGKIKVIRTCGSCSATDSYEENKFEYGARIGW